MKNKIIAGLTAAVVAISLMPFAMASEINPTYDETEMSNTCEVAAEGLVLNDGAPDGSKYYTLESGTYRNLGGLSMSTTEDYLWEMDIRFNDELAGFTVKDLANKKVNTCIRRYDGKLAMEVSTGKYTSYDDIDPDTWYHIQLIGQYGTSEPLDMEVYQWKDGSMEHLNTYEGVSKRNNVAAGYMELTGNVSVDNVKITKIGADALTLSTAPVGVTTLNAGGSVQMQIVASRQGKKVNTPHFQWKVFQGENEIRDGSVTINSEGMLTTDKYCPDTEVTVKAISEDKGNVEGSYRVTVKAVDLEKEKYDTIEISAERDVVSEDAPLEFTVSASKKGSPVTLEEGDVTWRVYNKANIQETGNKYIYVENNTLYVSKEVVAQDITLRAGNESGTVSASAPVKVEQHLPDALLVTNACEELTSGVTQQTPSWDGSYYFKADAVFDMDSVSVEAGEDVVISADIKFGGENAGFKLRNPGNTKEGGQISYQGGKIGRVGASNKFLAFADADTQSWYHIDVITRCGGEGAYGTAYIYKYDENGQKVNPNTGAAGVPVEGVLDLRTVGSQTFQHIQLQENTSIDNLSILKAVPDSIEMSLSAETVFAGNTVLGTYTVSRQGIEMKNFPQSKVKWAVYDSENKYPIEGEDVTVNASGEVSISPTAEEQTVYIRATLLDNDLYSSKPISIKGSEIFTVEGFGVNTAENGSQKLVELSVSKSFFYNDKVSFIVGVYGEDGTLINVQVKSMYGDALAIGNNKITLNMNLPDQFGEVKAMVWTSLK